MPDFHIMDLYTLPQSIHCFRFASGDFGSASSRLIDRPRLQKKNHMLV